MRQNPTPAEAKLWNELRAKRFAGHKFRHQNVIGRYIADFACRLPMLIVEVDGDTHADQERYDARRTVFLQSRGYKVIRFTNADVMANLEGVLCAIGEALTSLSPSGEREKPQSGEGEGQSETAALAQTPPLPSPLP
jgi:very-short-patch-repair endonuclease